MWTKTGIESEGQYAVTQELAITLRQILENDDKHENWKKLISEELKTSILNLQNLSLPEVDVIFSILSGGDFQGLQAGSHAITKNKQLITVIGFSKDWEGPNQLAAKTDAELFKKLKLKMNMTSIEDKVIGLYYDQTAKEQQELILLNPYDVTPIVSLDSEESENKSPSFLGSDIQLIKHLFGILSNSTDSNDYSTVESKLQAKQLNIHILKTLTHLINTNGSQILSLLQNEGLLQKLVDYLYQSQQTSNDKCQTPIEWLELRCSQIKKAALENDISLVPNKDEVTAAIQNGKQVVIYSNDDQTGETMIQNTHLLSAINIHQIQPYQQFKCHLQKDLINFAVSIDSKTLVKTYGLVFYDAQELQKLDEKAINVLLSSQVIVTTNEIQPKELFTKLSELVKKDDEKEEKERKLNGLLESIILFVRKSDFERIQKPLVMTIKPQFKQQPTILEGLIHELKDWAGLDQNKLLAVLEDTRNEGFNKMSMALVKYLKETNEEKLLNQDKIKKLEVDNKIKELDILKKKISDAEEKKAKEIEEKLLKLKESGIGGAQLSLLEKVVKFALEKETDVQFNEKLEILDIIKDEKDKKKIETIIEKKVSPYTEDKQDEAQKAKSDKTSTQEFWDQVNQIDLKRIDQEYDLSLNNLSTLYRRRTLINILAHADLKTLAPQLLNDKKSQKQFACFIKSSFNEALLVFFNSGQKSLLKVVKQIIKNIFKFCSEESQYAVFLRDFFRYDILESGINSVKIFVKDGCKSVKEQFNSQEAAVNQLNPFLFTFVLKQYIVNYQDQLFIVDTYLINIFNTILGMILYFQDDKTGLLARLYGSVLQLLSFIEKNLEKAIKNGSLEKLLNNELLKLMVESIDYDSSSKFNTQQKLLLEIHMKLIDLHTQINEKRLAIMDSNLENSEGILSVKRGKSVLQQREKFDFLKYYIHYQNLDDDSKEVLNQVVETNHYAFDSKILAKFSIKQTEKITINFKEKSKLKDFTFVGISKNANGSSIEYYSQEEIKGANKSLTLYKNDFYLFYPIRKQMVISFGEGSDDRLGLANSANTLPKPAYSTKNLKPKRVISSYWHTVIIDEEDNLFRCGQVKKSGSSFNDFQKVSNINDKIKLVSLGKFSIYVVDNKNVIYRQGYNKDGHLGMNTDYSNMTKLEKIEDQDQIQENIVEMTSGTHFTLFITESGKLYGIGNRFLKEIGQDCDDKIIQIPVREGVKVLKAWGSLGKKQPLAIIKVRLENGEEQLQSAGKSDQGLLGQGQLVKVSKMFRPIKYDSENIKFVDFSMHTDHAVAIDQNGQMWAWGSNVSKRSGFKEDIFDGVFEPKRVTFPEKENLKPIRVQAGFDHTLVLFEDENKVQKIYSIGQDSTNYFHLGITIQEAEEQSIFYREISAFRGFNIQDFTAGHRSSFVIIGGDTEPTSSLYEHKYNDQSSKGLLHFYKDNQGHLKYINQDEYQLKKDDLPLISFAIKCPIENLDQIELPDLDKLAQDLIDHDNLSEEHKDEKCSLTQELIVGPRYHSICKINRDNQEVDLSEKSIFQPNCYDINPLIYYRIRKPLKQGAKLPVIDLKKYYKESAAYGIEIELVPDLQFQNNDQLINETKSQFDEIIESVNKFLPELDNELLREMDKYIKSNLSDKDLDSIKAKDDFKIADMTFRNPKLKKLTENVKRRRVELYLYFNQMFIKLLPYICLDDKASGGDMTQQFQSMKNMILFSIKNKFLQTSVGTLPSGNSGYVEIRRRKAQRFIDQGLCDHKGEHTIFGQIFQQIKTSGFDCFRQNSTDTKTWSTKFLGEGSIDAGGPYRECLTNMCTEIESEFLPLLIKTVNNRNNHGENRDSFIPNPASNSPTHMELLKFFGYLLGFAIRTLSPLPLHLAPIFWKQILGDPLLLNDLKGIDTYTWQVIDDLRKQSVKLSNEDFNIAIEETFVTRLSDGTEAELKKGGKNIKVTKDNLEEFIQLIQEKRFVESEAQVKAIREGIDFVIPIELLKLFTWEEVEIRACGDKVLDVERLKGITEYYCCEKDNEFILRFWRVLEEMTDEHKQLYLKFVWGRARLPAETTNIRDRHTLYLCSSRGDKDFPEAHTCFFQLDLPKYTTDEICKQRMITAITMCGEIDADHNADYIPDDDDAE